MNAPIAATALERIDASRLPLQVAIFLSGGRMLAAETFKLVSFQGQESLSDLFEYNLELHASTQATRDLNLPFDSLLGRPVTVGLQLPMVDGPERFRAALFGRPEPELSLFNGIVAGFGMDQPGVYRLTMRPALWKLGLANRYQAYPGLTLREAVSGVLRRHGVEHRYVDDVDGAHDPSLTRTQDWLQAGESDLDFVRRLLAKAHLFYFFEHRGNGHALVISAGAGAYPPVHADGHPLRYTHTGSDPLGLEQEDTLTQYSYQQTLASSHVEGVYVRQEAVWERDGVVGYQPYPAAAGVVGDLPFHQYKVYPYGLSEMEAKYLAKQAEQALDATRGTLSGAGRCAKFRAGHLFRLTGSVMANSQPMPVRPSLEGRDYVLTQVKHQASLDGGYQNDFQASEKAPVVAFSMQDTQQGSLLAIVIAHGEGRAPKDWRYYPRDVFDPQSTSETDTQAHPATLVAKGIMVRLATQAETEAGLWVRVPTSMSNVPEIGAMVLIGRGNDESELPELQNVLSTGGSKTITPDGWTAHSSVGNNYSTSWGDSKSVRCGAATPNVLDEGRRLVEAAYQSGEYKDSSYSRGAGYSYSTSENGRDGLLSRSQSYGCNYSHYYGRETKSWSEIGYSYSESTVADSDSINTLTGTSNNTSTTNISNNTSTTNISTSTSTTGTHSDTSTVGSSSSVSTIGMQNGASAIGMQNNASVLGLSNGVSATGMRNEVSVTGMSNSASAVGMSNSASTVGMNNSVSLIGASISTSLTGTTTSTNITGTATDISVTGVLNFLKVVGVTNDLSVKEGVTDINVDGLLVLHIDGAVMSMHVPGFDLEIENGILMVL
jgi:type VI secretion system secreted protein VgrG